jgi:hypothetical protein
VCTFKGRVDCTCPDATRNFAACKHQQALRALGLIPASARPAGQLTWEALHPKPTRKPRRATAPVPAAAASGPDPLAKARRRHQPAVADPAPAFAASFRAAVAEHVAALAKGGVS